MSVEVRDTGRPVTPRDRAVVTLPVTLPVAIIKDVGDVMEANPADNTSRLVEKIKDFSLAGYDEDFPKSAFLSRVREDRDHDGKLDHEKLTARGALPQARVQLDPHSFPENGFIAPVERALRISAFSRPGSRPPIT